MERLKIDDFVQYRFLSNIKYSPDGRYLCFAAHQADSEENTYRSNLWLYDLEQERCLQLTAFDEESQFIWRDDGREILFAGTRSPKDREKREAGEVFTQFYRIRVDGGEAREAFRLPYKVTSIVELDATTLLFSAIFDPHQPELEELSEEEKALKLAQYKEEKDYEVLEEIPFWNNGSGFSHKKRTRLYLYAVPENRVQPLTDPLMDVQTFRVNDAKTNVVVTARSYQHKMEVPTELYLYDIATQQATTLPSDSPFLYGYADFLTDDTLMYTGSDMQRYGCKENHKFYVRDLKSGDCACLTPELDLGLDNKVASDCRYGVSHEWDMQRDGAYLYFVSTEGDSSFLNRIDRTGAIERVIGKEGTIDQYWVREGKIAFIGFRGLKLHEVYLAQAGAERQLTQFNENIHKSKTLSVPEKIRVETAEGVTVDGWIMKPIGFEAGRTYPAILNIHGGPKGAYSANFFHEMQYWTNEGYVVFYCNPRGSEGKGNAFADIRGRFGTIDYEDIMRFTDDVLDRYTFIDRDRVGVTGGSYGGFMTNWIIGQTDRFKAAASQRSIANWISKFCTTDIGYYFVADQQGATPWEDYETLWTQSPLKYAHRAITPTLFIHSEQDYRCWMAEGLQMFTALKYHGVDARLCLFRGENHELSRSGKPQHRIRRLQEITTWFDRYLKQPAPETF